MYLSDRDLEWAIKCRRLIILPEPKKIDASSIDLHLDSVEKARVWDVARFETDNLDAGHEGRELRTSKINYKNFSRRYQIPVPSDPTRDVFRRHNQIIIRPGGFVLWQTHEIVGTPEEFADLICFVDSKSTRARTGIVVHLTAPTIHAGWSGKVTLEIVNLGPFDLIMQEYEDAIAQLTVAKITSPPIEKMKDSATFGQTGVGGTTD
jgi:deoxycytidine triphosphate deaminase